MDTDSPAPQATPTPPGTTGLQARKKLAAMHRIQEAALGLFEQHGFDAVAIGAVAEAADVAPRTVYRYFGTKEMLVIWDEEDERPPSPLIPQFAASDPIEALRTAVRAGFAAMGEDGLRLIRRRVALIYRTPALEAAFGLHSYEKSRAITAALAPSQKDRFETQVFVHAFVGAFLGALRHWYLTDFSAPLLPYVDRALTLLAQGFNGTG